MIKLYTIYLFSIIVCLGQSSTTLWTTIEEASTSSYARPDITGVATVLAPGIEDKLLESKNVVAINDLRYAVPVRTDKYCYLYMQISLAGEFNFESIYHGTFLARKPLEAKDWSNCDLYRIADALRVDMLPYLNDSELLASTVEHHTPKFSEFIGSLYSLETMEMRLSALSEYRENE
ncbi:hypothetical protein [Cerasicoccus fimbriatus]|uniref:hypothetical protein n=1 Tax=Cerasicoccus fimbriatus TaxID=3014554 RepID=UPI0022B5DA87|nr:hypothetical protein [Cerasicoccus sp. TK19100]